MTIKTEQITLPFSQYNSVLKQNIQFFDHKNEINNISTLTVVFYIETKCSISHYKNETNNASIIRIVCCNLTKCSISQYKNETNNTSVLTV